MRCKYVISNKQKMVQQSTRQITLKKLNYLQP